MARARLLPRATALTALALVGAGLRLAAQSASDLLARGVLAYQRLDYEVAVSALRASIGREPPAALGDSERARALVYLGATELFQRRRDSAMATFRALVQLDPRYRPDELIFPPQVTNLFEDVRRSTRVLAVSVPPQTVLKAREGWFTARVIASPAQHVVVTLAHADRTPLRTLYDGSVAESLVVKWDGLTGRGALADAGRYVMRVALDPATGDGPRSLEVTLEITHDVPDTLPWPAAPVTPVPEGRRSAPPLGVVGATALAGGTVVALPSLFGRSADATRARFVVAAVVGIAGIVGILAHHARAVEADGHANDPVWRAWRQRVGELEAANAKARSGVGLRIRAGPVVVTDRRAP